jgi:hypothetical protein
MSDGLSTTYYSSATNAISWVKADFGGNVTLSHVYLADSGGNGTWGAVYLNGSVIATSTDDITYTTFATASGHTGNGAEIDYTGSVTCRYVRVQQSAGWISLSQMRFA